MYARTVRALVVSLFLAVGGAAHAGALDGAPFSASPGDLLAAAKAAPKGASAVVLRDDETITFDDRGRVARRYDVIAVIEDRSAIDAWATIDLDWRPFFQDQPTIRARVIAADGKVAEIDHQTVHAQLPPLAVGSVIEEEFTIDDHEPLFAPGEVELAYVGRGVPVTQQRITINAPIALALHVVARGFASTPQPAKTRGGAVATWTFDLGATPGASHDLDGVPGDVVEYPYIGVASGRSWAAVAKDLRRAIDARTKDALALPDGIRAKTPRETIDHALAWLQAHVKIDGADVRAAALVPSAPKDVAAHDKAGAIDRAALLVALLRGAGVRADLALIRTGPGTDVDRELPGVGTFDRAIVRARLGTKDLWIDPAEALLPAGQLPSRDQGRLALIVAADTKDLAATPIGANADNLVRETHTFHVAELDHGSVTEVSEEHGALGGDQRAWYSTTARADAEASLTKYARTTYDGALRTFAGTDAADLTQPFRLTIEVDDASHVHTDREHAGVWLYPTDTFGHLPAIFTATDDATDAAVKHRTIDYVFPTPHVVEIEHRVVLPPGFTAPALIAHDEQTLGTMTLTTTRAIDHGDVVITYRLDTGKRRISADELRTTRYAVLRQEQAQAEKITIAQTGAELLHAGKAKEAIAEYQRLIALHPKEAVHYDQLADAYIQLGMGTAARRTARDGIRIEPTSGDAYEILAAELRADSTGYENGFDADRAGALAAFEKALALTPDHRGALADLANTYASDERGAPTTNRADQLRSIATYKKLVAISHVAANRRAMVAEMLAAGQYGTAEAEARALPDDPDNDAMQVAAAALGHSPKEAIALADRMASGLERTRILGMAIAWLKRERAYDAMRVLIAELGADYKTKQADVLQRLAQIDLAKIDPADPKRAVLEGLLLVSGLRTPQPPWDDDVGEALEREYGRLSDDGRRAYDQMSRENVVDFLVAATQPQVEGDAKSGWRVTFAGNPKHDAFYVVLDHGRARIIGTTGAPSGLGHVALAAAKRKDAAAATRWIAWYLDDLVRTDPARKKMGAAYAVYNDAKAKAAGKPIPSETLELIAAMIATRHPDVPSLAALRGCATNQTGELQKHCIGSLSDSYAELQQWGDAADALLESPDRTTPPIMARIAYLQALAGRYADAEAMLDDVLAKQPDDIGAMMVRAQLLAARGAWTDAVPWVEKIAQHGGLSSTTLNNLAWLRLLHDADPKEALALARRAETLNGNNKPDPALFNTIAAALAHSDDPFGAWQYLRRAIALHVRHEPGPGDWYVLGRIAESYGLTDDAIADYRLAARDKRPGLEPNAREFALAALKRLGAKP